MVKEKAAQSAGRSASKSANSVGNSAVASYNETEIITRSPPLLHPTTTIMGYPNDDKAADGLPTYAPLPTDVENDTTLIDLRAERRRRRFRIFSKHAAFFFVATLGLLYIHHRRDKYDGTVAYVSTRIYHVYIVLPQLTKDGAQYEQNHRDEFFSAHAPFMEEPNHPHPHPYPAKCEKWSNKTAEENSTFTYSFPINSTSLHFIARGPLVGNVDYILADKNAPSDVIDISITLDGPKSRAKSLKHDGTEDEHREHASVWNKLRPSWIPFIGRARSWKPKAKVCLLQDHGSEEPSGFAIVVCTALPLYYTQ